MDLPNAGRLIDEYDRDLSDEDLEAGAAVEHAFGDADGPVQYYARRRLDQVLGRAGGADQDPLAGVGVDDETRATIDAWIDGYVLEWRTRFGSADVRPAA